MKKIVVALSLFFSLPSFAVLPPLYQSIKEYQALVNDPRLGEKLSSGEMIIDIKRGDQAFEVMTNKRKMVVKIVYEPQKEVGPAAFHLEF